MKHVPCGKLAFLLGNNAHCCYEIGLGHFHHHGTLRMKGSDGFRRNMLQLIFALVSASLLEFF